MDRILRIDSIDTLERMVYGVLSEDDHVTVVAKYEIILDLMRKCLQNKDFRLESISISSEDDRYYYFEIWDLGDGCQGYIGEIENDGVMEGICFVQSSIPDAFSDIYDVTPIKFYIADNDCSKCICRIDDGDCVVYEVPRCAEQYIDEFDELFSKIAADKGNTI